ncbi:MAG TPA: class I SAM-dependent methyltransferase [Rhizomicrobium sp.]|nr:class I SAM-dependent methyltransferase [Rhizomicrobium sp.]
MDPKPTSNFDAARRFAEFGLKEKAAGRRDSASGPGSSAKASAEALDFLRRVIAEHDIGSILDLGCGDWHWMRKLGLPRPTGGNPVHYEGWDASEPMVAELDKEFGNEYTSFKVKDITTEPLPNAELIVARDVLFHIDMTLVEGMIKRIRGACRFFATTSFAGVTRNTNIQSYMPIEGWGFHKINLDIAPFDLAPHLAGCVEEKACSHTGDKRYFCLYSFE